MKIKSTKLPNDITDINYIKFINIINDIIPIDIEEEYVNLSNIIINYINYNNEFIKYNNLFNKLNNEINNRNIYKHSLINKKNLLIKELDNIYNSLHFINDPKISFSINLWSIKKDSLEKEIKEYDNKINNLTNEIKEKLKERNKISLLMKTTKANLLNIISNININNLKELNINNLLGKHINEIRKLNLSKEEIKVLEETLINYIYIRILSFNIIKDIANDILNNNYKENNKINIIIKSLINFDLTKENYLIDLIYKPIYKVNLDLMKLIKDYIKNNNINLDNINKINNVNIFTTNETLLTKELIYDMKESKNR